ncbi:extensin-like isoform X1 [Anopheles albimanus]|uniref:extensin-like isoform X1 n=2 Tax=Anopheles albimanus TaxID=7167 RepID=UPI001640C567|nr:extensin-like isoform X1 [Anopheles albimanus]
MRHSEGFVILAVLLELCTVRQGETKTIVFNSYSSGPSGSATESPTSGDDAWNGTASVAQEQSSESAGRAFGTSGPSASGFPFSLPSSYLSKPVQVARPVDSGYKTPKYIVYPSYTANSVPNYGGPVAMDRFAPGEAYGGTIYKLKKQRQPGGGGGSFASIPAASFNSPVSVAVPGPALRPAASDNAPVVISAPPQPPGPPPGPSPSNGPPSPPSSPTSDGGPPGPPATFIPTPNPSSGEDDSTSPRSAGQADEEVQQDSSELILSPPNSHIGYLPPEKQMSKKPNQPNMPVRQKNPSPEDLQKFPPNSDQSYPVTMMVSSRNPVTSYQPPASGNTESMANLRQQSPTYKATPELFKFPPNVNANYLPPTANDSKQPSVTSYLPPPSGDPQSPDNQKPIASNSSKGSVPPQDLFKFPPNINVAYLPSKESSQNSVTSYLPPASGSPSAPSNLVTIMPPSSASDSTFKFPPNIHSNYPAQDGMEKLKAHVTSYLPPASGSPDSPANLMATISTSSAADSSFKFPPNVNSNYLPPNAMAKPESHATSYLPPASGDPNANYPHKSAPPSSPSQPYLPPASLFQFPPNIHSPYLPPKHSPQRPNNAVTSYLPPASGIPGDGTIGTIPVGPGKPQYLPPYYDNRPPAPSASPPMNMPPMQMMQMMQMMKDTPMTGPPTGPSGMDAVHNHDHHHHDFPDFSAFEHDHYPDIIYDHDHDHYHHHHHHDEPTTPPPPPPPPPAPETPRLKNYSYYYLSRTLWYVPLYFTLYFTFYVAILIIRSIARHKVNLPNQWVGNARSFSSIRDLSNAQTQQKATMMAAFTMKQIEDFREKYL